MCSTSYLQYACVADTCRSPKADWASFPYSRAEKRSAILRAPSNCVRPSCFRRLRRDPQRQKARQGRRPPNRREASWREKAQGQRQAQDRIRREPTRAQQRSLAATRQQRQVEEASKEEHARQRSAARPADRRRAGVAPRRLERHHRLGSELRALRPTATISRRSAPDARRSSALARAWWRPTLRFEDDALESFHPAAATDGDVEDQIRALEARLDLKLDSRRQPPGQSRADRDRAAGASARYRADQRGSDRGRERSRARWQPILRAEMGPQRPPQPRRRSRRVRTRSQLRRQAAPRCSTSSTAATSASNPKASRTCRTKAARSWSATTRARFPSTG